MKFDYKPNGVCARNFTIEIDEMDNTVKDYVVEAGCPGNSLGLKSLMIGQNIDDVIEQLKGIKCGRKNTSCPDQVSQALELYKKSIDQSA